jgi:chromosomal replication initiation ATPase DnaA
MQTTEKRVDEIIDTVSTYYGVSINIEYTRKCPLEVAKAKQVICYFIYLYTDVRDKDVCYLLRYRNRATVTKNIKLVLTRFKSSNVFRYDIHYLGEAFKIYNKN